MREAKSQISKLVALAQRGESVTISIQGRPMVKLVPIKPQGPMDRLLMAQAIVEDMTIVTIDGAFASYAGKIMW
jgi:prevent-host-death family protein